jgi:hypothetical protein
MKARRSSSKDCFDYRIKIDDAKDIAAEEMTSDEATLNSVGAGVTGCYEGIESERTE